MKIYKTQRWTLGEKNLQKPKLDLLWQKIFQTQERPLYDKNLEAQGRPLGKYLPNLEGYLWWWKPWKPKEKPLDDKILQTQ